MKLAFSTNAFTRFPLIDAIDAIGQIGYEGVEILADVPHAYPARMDAELTAGVVVALRRNNLHVSNVNVNCTFGYWQDAPPEPYFEPSIISPIKRYREDRIAFIAKSILFAKEIGARNISITSGRMLGGVDPRLAVSHLEDSLKRILDLAEREKMDVGVECEPGLFLEYIEELADWMNRLGSPRLGANLDVGHCQVIGESIPEEVRRVGKRIWNLHVEGMPGRKHFHLVPGDPLDTLGWKGLKAALAEVGYDRFATVELYTMTADPHAAARESLDFLRRWAEGG
jgi:sugar phosphate isomerase/epimerase